MMRSYWFFDQLLDILVDGSQTAGRYSICEFWAPAGCQTPLHVHDGYDEGWYVIEGEQTVWVGAETHVLGPGDYAAGPAGVPHTFEVTGDGELHALVTSLPGGFEDYLRAFGTPAEEHRLPVLEGPPDLERAARLAAECGIELLGPPGMLPTEPSQHARPGPAVPSIGRATRRASGRRSHPTARRTPRPGG